MHGKNFFGQEMHVRKRRLKEMLVAAFHYKDKHLIGHYD